MKKKTKQAREIKLIFIFILFFAIMSILVYRVFAIMFIENREYQKDAYLQKTAETILKAKRGNIYDRDGEKFSISLTVSKFFLDPRLVKEVYGGYEEDNDVDVMFDFIHSQLGIEKEELIGHLDHDTHYRIFASEIPAETADRIIEYRQSIGFKGLFREKSIKRYYPNELLGAHVIGYTDQELQGRLGVEYYYNSALSGADGISIIEVDGLGREIPFSDNIEIAPADGNDIYLTLDKNIQLLTQEALRIAIDEYKVVNGGSIIVMEPGTGKILGLASYPEFNANEPYGGKENISSEDVDHLQQFVWRNKAISDTYEPGSTFKVITAAAVLEEGVYSADDIIESGPVTVEGWKISHWMENPAYSESFRDAMFMSSNPVFVRGAQKLGINRFYEYIKKFGFMDITGISLPGEGNSIFRERPSELDMAVNSFGQRFQITPIQLISAYCAIANGGYLVKPYIVDKIVDSKNRIVFEAKTNIFRQVISEQTSDTLKEMLEGTVTYGTGKNAYVKGYRVAGKTGTSETLQTDEGRYIASFAGFAPVDSPKVALLVIIDHPTTEHHGGGFVAAPIAGKLLEDILVYLRVEREYTEYDMEIISKETVIPDITDMEPEEAEELLRSQRINYHIIGRLGDAVVRQLPKSGEVVSQNPVVILFGTESENRIVEVPDLKGLTMDEALYRLKSMNLNVVYKGSGEVVSQSPEKGEMIEPGSIINVEFREMEYANQD